MTRRLLEHDSSELTVKAVALGCVLAVCMAAANLYLVLYAGLTVSASISAAVVSMGIFRGKRLRGTILENNIVQTIASAGESVAAGVAITIPALLITGVWTDFQFWPVTLATFFGGILGVLFTIPLRHALIVEEKDLVYPEGVACAEVLRAGETGGVGVIRIFAGFVFGLVFKFAAVGLGLFAATVERIVRIGPIPWLFGCDISPALVSVGFIIGLNIAVLIFVGGVISWIIGVPCYYLLHGSSVGSHDIVDIVQQIWAEKVRFIGVGTMIVGGAWSIIEVRRGIGHSMRQFWHGIFPLGMSRTVEKPSEVPRTERDLDMRVILLVLVPVVCCVLLLISIWSGSWQTGLVIGAITLAMVFLFVAVACHIVGLVGTSNNPISGMTIGALFLIAFTLLLMNAGSRMAMLVSLSVASIVCCAASTAGDMSQDLMTGYRVRATPRRQQLAKIVGVMLVAFIMAPLLSVLHHAYGIGMLEGRDGPASTLRAPQASLFAGIVGAVFKSSREIPWGMIEIGFGVGVALIALDTLLKRAKSPFRTHAMPVAVGIYLPLGPAVALLLGGLTAWLAKRIRKARTQEDASGTVAAESATSDGVLVGSGLIAGEAIMGVLAAAMLLMKIELPRFAIPRSLCDVYSVVALVLVAITLLVISARSKKDL